MVRPKQKGNSFEYDCQQSLQQCFKNVARTAERGYQMQYDLTIYKDDTPEILAIIECKRLKGISWNELEKFYKKLCSKSPSQRIENHLSGELKYIHSYNIICYVLFQSNHQPCLVYSYYNNIPSIKRFEDVFGVPFIKHKSTRPPKIMWVGTVSA